MPLAATAETPVHLTLGSGQARLPFLKGICQGGTRAAALSGTPLPHCGPRACPGPARPSWALLPPHFPVCRRSWGVIIVIII